MRAPNSDPKGRVLDDLAHATTSRKGELEGVGVSWIRNNSNSNSFLLQLQLKKKRDDDMGRVSGTGGVAPHSRVITDL